MNEMKFLDDDFTTMPTETFAGIMYQLAAAETKLVLSEERINRMVGEAYTLKEENKDLRNKLEALLDKAAGFNGESDG